MVMQLSRPVEAEPDIKTFFGEELAPLVVDRRAVSLDAVDEFFVRRYMFFLQVDGLAEKIDAQQGRFAAVPGEADDFPGCRLNMLDDIALESFVIQAEVRPLRIKILFVQIVAIVTIEVA